MVEQRRWKIEAGILRAAAVALALLLVVLVGLHNVMPRMQDAIWQDEAVTLLYSSGDGVIHPFLNFRSPNNHVLFSSMLAGWLQLFPDGVDLFRLRLLPLSLFLAALPLTYLAAAAMGGRWTGVLAGLLFAASTVIANFAVQLRGYGPSWIFMSLVLLSAIRVGQGRPGWWLLAYLVSCIGAVAILPSNILFVLAVGVAVACHGWLSGG
jgi:uncharacterized membrane protein